MPDWQERITHETSPALVAEHELRYRTAAPLIASSAVWGDLGCGNGVAAAAALGASRPPNAVLVDVDSDAVALAARELDLPDAVRFAGDLTVPDALSEIDRALLAVDGQRVVTCFEVVEHLGTFVPLLEWSGELARAGAATFVLSVPNDAFWSIRNPHHRTSWSDGAFEELRRLLPDATTLWRQVTLSGSTLVDWGASPTAHDVAVHAGGEATVASHFIASYGPRHRELWHGAVVVQADLVGQRQWERQREANAAVAQEMVAEYQRAIEEQEQTLAEQRAELQANAAEFTEWRAYIHQLEQELGRPLAGSAEAPPPHKPAGAAK